MNVKTEIISILTEDQQYTLKGLNNLLMSIDYDLKSPKKIKTEIEKYALRWIMDEFNLEKNDIFGLNFYAEGNTVARNYLYIKVEKIIGRVQFRLILEIYLSTSPGAPPRTWCLSGVGTIGALYNVLADINIFDYLNEVKNGNYFRKMFLDIYKFKSKKFNDKLIRIRERRLLGLPYGHSELSDAKKEFESIKDVMTALGIVR